MIIFAKILYSQRFWCFYFQRKLPDARLRLYFTFSGLPIACSKDSLMNFRILAIGRPWFLQLSTRDIFLVKQSARSAKSLLYLACLPYCCHLFLTGTIPTFPGPPIPKSLVCYIGVQSFSRPAWPRSLPICKFININWLSCGKLTEPAMSAFIAYLLFSKFQQRNLLGLCPYGCRHSNTLRALKIILNEALRQMTFGDKMIVFNLSPNVNLTFCDTGDLCS